MNRLLLLMVRNPVLPWGLFIAGAVWGLLALSRMPLALLPLSQPVGLTIRLEHPGSDGESVERRLTLPMEGAMAGLPDLIRLESMSEGGLAQLHLTFAPGTDLGPVTAELRRRLANLEGRLPGDARRPVVLPLTPEVGADLVLSFAGGDGSNGDGVLLRRRLERELKPMLERDESVARVDLTGGQMREVHGKTSGGDLAARGLSPLLIGRALDRWQNVDGPMGFIIEESRVYPMEIRGRPNTLEALERIPVATPSGRPVPLGQVATFRFAGRGEEEVTTENGTERPGLYVTLRQGPGYLAASPRLCRMVRETLGPGTRVEVSRDRTRALRKSLWELVGAVLLSMAISLLLIRVLSPGGGPVWPLLLSFPAALLPATGVLAAAGGSLNGVSLSGLSLGATVGLDAHLVILALTRRNGLGERSLVAGLRRVFVPLMASLGASAIIFIPLFSLRADGTAAFRELAWGFFPCLFFSLLSAMTLTAHLLARHRRPEGTIRYQASWLRIHGGILEALRRRRFQVRGAVALLLIATALVAPFLRRGEETWFPKERGELTVYFEFPPDMEGERIRAFAGELEGAMQRAFPEILKLTARFEASRVEWNLKTTARGKDLDKLSRNLTARFGQAWGGFMHGGGAASADGPADGSLMEVTGEDPAVVRALAREGAARLAARPWCREVLLHWREGRPEWRLLPDETALARSGLTVREGGEMLRTRFFGPVVGKFLDLGGRECDVRLTVTGPAMENGRDLGALPLAGSNGGALTVAGAFHLTETLAPTRRSRSGRLPVERFSVRAEPGRSDWKADRDRVLGTLPLPPGYRLEAGGDERGQAGRHRDIGWAVGAAVLLVWMWLAAVRGSATAPLPILAILIPAGCGGIWGLFLTGHVLGSGALLGFLMLAGLAVNAAILMEDALRGSRVKVPHGAGGGVDGWSPGRPPVTATAPLASLHVFRACKHRLTTALLTGGTFLLGLIPLMVAGDGPVASLAIVLFFGTITAIGTSLFILPLASMARYPLEGPTMGNTALDRFWQMVLKPIPSWKGKRKTDALHVSGTSVGDAGVYGRPERLNATWLTRAFGHRVRRAPPVPGLTDALVALDDVTSIRHSPLDETSSIFPVQGPSENLQGNTGTT